MADKKINVGKLIDSYLEISSSDNNVLDEALREYGYDPKQIESRGLQKIKHLLFIHQVAANKEKLYGYYAKALTMFQQTTETSREFIFALLHKKSPSLQFRNLEQLDEENLRQILDETEILELIDKMEREDLK